MKELSKFTVGIAGCGGLGSNCAIALARVGIGKLVIADFDTVSESNLNRQYFFIDQLGQPKSEALRHNLSRVSRVTEVEDHNCKLDPSSITRLFSDCDIIVEAFDLAEMKQMLIETVLGDMPDKPVIAASGIAGYGDNNKISTQQYGNLYICGDFGEGVSESNPPLGPKVGAIACMQANQVLEILLTR